jgi:hypothetical protein
MADFKKLAPGDPLLNDAGQFCVSAEAFNAMMDAAQAKLDRQHDVATKRSPQAADRGIVWVTNNGSTGDDWPAWAPVGVAVPNGTPIDYAAQFAARPYFPGYRLDNASLGARPLLGITQEPIAAGAMGRVCIRGATAALMQACPESGWTNYAGWDWVQVRKVDDRWTLRNGPAGDARLLKFLDFDLYQDGTYDDQYLVLIDLCEVPNRIPFTNLAGETIPALSIIQRAITEGATAPDATTTSYTLWQEGVVLCGSCGWDVPDDGYGWCYKFDPTIPVCVTHAYHSSGAEHLGPAGGSFVAWPWLTGFDTVCPDWVQSSGATPYRVWVRKSLHAMWAKADAAMASGTASAHVCDSTGAYVFDGSTVYDSVTLPEVASTITWRSANGRQPNVQTDGVFAVTVNGGQLLGDPSHLDDKIGTVKLLISGAIPAGWREYTGLQGNFPVGYKSGDADFGGSVGSTGGAKTHTHAPGAGTPLAAGTDYALPAASHLPPFCLVKFIERYQ